MKGNEAILSLGAGEHAAEFHPLYASLPELIAGADVIELLEDKLFIEQWNSLCNKCKWSTVFQTPAFVATWYRLYESEYLPIIIRATVNGDLTALITLTRHPNGLITGAGAGMAEYVVWLSEYPDSEMFIKAALQEIDIHFPGSRVVIKYIPHGTPISFAVDDPLWKNRCVLSKYTQPRILIDETHFCSELKKKKKRERLNRLKNLGDLKLERIVQYNEFASIIDELTLQFDFRKGAMHNKLPFKTDSQRKMFLLNLFKQGLLHVTVLRLNGKIIASNVGAADDMQLHLQGINSHAPEFGKYSPGIVHFLLLSKLLHDEGIKIFDLTPGGDAYKETLANDHTVAYHLIVGDSLLAPTFRIKSALKSYLRKKIPMAFASSGKKIKHRVFSIGVAGSRIWNRNTLFSIVAPVVQKFKLAGKLSKGGLNEKVDYHHCTSVLPVNKNSLKDLIEFHPHSSRFSRQAFLAEAMERFQRDEHCFTWSEDGTLMACAWMRKGDALPADASSAIKPQMFQRVYCHPKAHNRLSDFLHSIRVNFVAGGAMKLYFTSLVLF